MIISFSDKKIDTIRLGAGSSASWTVSLEAGSSLSLTGTSTSLNTFNTFNFPDTSDQYTYGTAGNASWSVTNLTATCTSHQGTLQVHSPCESIAIMPLPGTSSVSTIKGDPIHISTTGRSDAIFNVTFSTTIPGATCNIQRNTFGVCH